MPPTRSHFSDMTLILIPTIDEFNSIKADHSYKHGSNCKNHRQSFKPKLSPLSEDIIIPKCGKVPNIHEFVSQRRKSSQPLESRGYMRLPSTHNIPNPFEYETTEQDLRVWQNLCNKHFPFHIFNSQFTKKVLQTKHLGFLFKTFEELYHSDNSQDRKVLGFYSDPNKYSLYIAQTHGWVLGEDTIRRVSEFTCEVFNYWGLVKKERQGFPLIRRFWPNLETANLLENVLMPFKERSSVVQKNVNQLKSIGVLKRVSKNQRNHQQDSIIISSLEEWRRFYNVHRAQKQDFEEMVRKFHNYAELWGFQCPGSVKSIYEKNNGIHRKVSNQQTNSSSVQSTNSIDSSKMKICQKKKENPPQQNFKSPRQWINFQKKSLRNEKKKINRNSPRVSSQPHKKVKPSSLIEISDDQTGLELKNKQQNDMFADNSWSKMMQKLETEERFGFVIHEDNDEDESEDSFEWSLYEERDDQVGVSGDFDNVDQKKDFNKLPGLSETNHQPQSMLAKPYDPELSQTTIFDQQQTHCPSQIADYPPSQQQKKCIPNKRKRKTLFKVNSSTSEEIY